MTKTKLPKVKKSQTKLQRKTYNANRSAVREEKRKCDIVLASVDKAPNLPIAGPSKKKKASRKITQANYTSEDGMLYRSSV